jgi:hypothetical protein
VAALIVDTYEALTTKGPYQRAISPDAPALRDGDAPQ